MTPFVDSNLLNSIPAIRGVIFAFLLWFSPIVCGSESFRFQIPLQPLATALTEFADQASTQILFKADQIPQHVNVELYGLYAPNAALTKLLKGTDLTFRFGENAAVIYSKPSTPSNPIITNTTTNDARPYHSTPPVTEELIVTGFRKSLIRSLDIKRLNDTFSDVITNEDIGKFPDKNIADSLQRVPGVSVDRIWGEGRDINIRGTDKDVNRTLLNGQNVASAYWWANDNPSRGFNYSILASELVSSVEIFKSPRADMDEGSIGGTVYLHTRAPLELTSNEARATIEGQYSELPNTVDPQGSVLVNWQNNSGNFGLLSSVTYQKRHVRRDGLEAFPRGQNYQVQDENGQIWEDVSIPWGTGSALFKQVRERTTSHLSAQWYPSRQWDLSANVIMAQMKMNNSNHNYLALFDTDALSNGALVNVLRPELKESPSGGYILSGGTLGSDSTHLPTLDAIFREADIKTQFYDIDAKYSEDNWTLHTQIGQTTAEGGSDHDYLFRFSGQSAVDYGFEQESIIINFLDIDPTAASSLTHFSDQSRDWIRKMEDSELFGQLDLEYDLQLDQLQRLKAGFKLRKRKIVNNRTQGTINTESERWPQLENFSLDNVSNEVSPTLHSETGIEGSLRRYALVDFGLVSDRLIPQLSDDVFIYEEDQSAFYKIQENIAAAYLLSFWEHNKLKTNFGFRWIKTQQDSNYFDKEKHLVSHKRSYANLLPSLNMLYAYSNTLQSRFSAARVMARPSFPNLSGNVIIDGQKNNAFSGNPNLEPFKADQLDLGIEWYFRNASLIAADIFYKELSTFLIASSENEVIDGQVHSVSRPLNAQPLDMWGVELQWQQDLGLNFGITANYTFTDTGNGEYPGIDKVNLPGNSRDQFNSSLYYEDATWSARISYNYRSKSFGGFTDGSQNLTTAYDQWDFSSRWAVTKKVNLYLEGVNLKNQIVSYSSASGIPQGYYENGRRFTLGLRVSM